MSSIARKVIVIIMAALIVGTLMCGCGGSSGSDNSGTGSLSGSGK